MHIITQNDDEPITEKNEFESTRTWKEILAFYFNLYFLGGIEENHKHCSQYSKNPANLLRIRKLWIQFWAVR
jgi:hypothetical protein